MLVVQSCPTLCIPMTLACQAPLSMGFSRQECWSGLPCPSPGNLPDWGIKPASSVSPALHCSSSPVESLRKPSTSLKCYNFSIKLSQIMPLIWLIHWLFSWKTYFSNQQICHHACLILDFKEIKKKIIIVMVSVGFSKYVFLKSGLNKFSSIIYFYWIDVRFYCMA